MRIMSAEIGNDKLSYTVPTVTTADVILLFIVFTFRAADQAF